MNKPDIIEIVQREGTVLKRNMGLCPFHTEKTPSFKVDAQKQRFKCFGCGEGGDVIDFTIKLHGLSFKDALTYLGIEPGERPKVDREKRRQGEVQKEFEGALLRLYRELCQESIELHDLRIKVQEHSGSITEERSVYYALAMSRLSEIEYVLDLLWDGSAEEQLAALRENSYDNREATI